MLHLIPAPLHRLGLRVVYRLRERMRRWLKPNLAGVALIAVDGEGRVLLARHSYGSSAWALPGGGLKRGEDPEAAIRREIREELGCEIFADLRPLVPIHETQSGAPHTAHVFVGQLAGRPRPDRREVLEARFFALDALPADVGRLTRRRLDHYRAGRA